MPDYRWFGRRHVAQLLPAAELGADERREDVLNRIVQGMARIKSEGSDGQGSKK
jgi:hypothetical protein